ncbi:MAG: MFS transporter [Burkholderiales bacterium]|nr:MFS transporter [Burkholderiales bacterium]
MTIPYLEGKAGYRVVLIFAAAYVLSYAFRAINAVIAPALMEDLQLSNADLGLLTSAYFLGFASMQLPLGSWLDKYGARRTESALLLFAAAGAAIFAMSSTLTGLWIGRAMIGVGVSSCLMAPLKAYRVWYPAERQSQLGSWMLVFGTCGALTTTMPVAAILPIISWRGVFWIMSGLILLATALLFFKLKPIETEINARQLASQLDNATGDTASLATGYREIFASPYFRRMALLGAIHQGGFMAMQTLWAGPWMVRVLGLSLDQTSQVLFLFNFTLLLSYLVLSWWAPRYVSFNNKPGIPVLQAVSIGLAGTVIVQALMVFYVTSWSWILWVPFAILVTVTTLAQMHVSLAFPPQQAGRANSAFNLTLFIGAFSIQWGIGLLIDLFMLQGCSQSDAMRLSWGLYVLLQLAVLIIFVKSRAESISA